MSKLMLILELVKIIQANKDDLYALAMAVLEWLKKFQGKDAPLVGADGESIDDVVTATGLTREQVEKLVDAV